MSNQNNYDDVTDEDHSIYKFNSAPRYHLNLENMESENEAGARPVNFPRPEPEKDMSINQGFGKAIIQGIRSHIAKNTIEAVSAVIIPLVIRTLSRLFVYELSSSHMFKTINTDVTRVIDNLSPQTPLPVRVTMHECISELLNPEDDGYMMIPNLHVPTCENHHGVLPGPECFRFIRKNGFWYFVVVYNKSRENATINFNSIRHPGDSGDESRFTMSIFCIRGLKSDNRMQSLISCCIDTQDRSRKKHEKEMSSSIRKAAVVSMKPDGLLLSKNRADGTGRHVDVRPLSSLMIARNVNDEFIQTLKDWHSKKNAYLERGIPWRTGYMLIGPAGTGKTTVVRTVAAELGIPLYVLRISDFHTTEEFARRVETLSVIHGNGWDDDSLGSYSLTVGKSMYKGNGCIVVIEDADEFDLFKAAERKDLFDQDESRPERILSGERRRPRDVSLDTSEGQIVENRTDTDELTLEGFFNVIDGPMPQSGIVFIMTSNKKDPGFFDPALCRHGRFGEKPIIFDRVTQKEIIPYLERMYDRTIDVPTDGRTLIHPKTASEVESIVLKNYEDFDKAMELLTRN